MLLREMFRYELKKGFADVSFHAAKTTYDDALKYSREMFRYTASLSYNKHNKMIDQVETASVTLSGTILLLTAAGPFVSISLAPH